MQSKHPAERISRRRSRRSIVHSAFLLAALTPAVMAQQCISLANSAACPAFNQSSISTTVSNLFPFLTSVSDTQSFDERLKTYISTTYSKQKYQDLLGCSSTNLINTTELYARYTTTVLCNAIVQNSVQACSLSGNASRPLCADTCAEFAISEQTIAASPELCGRSGPNAISQIRADFTNCALPADSLSGTCITGVLNEPNDCGYRSNLAGLCSYCAKSSPNGTDSCCANARAESRCTNVHLPTTTSMPPLFPSSTSSGRPTATGNGTIPVASDSQGLSGGQIAGIVVGSLLGAFFLIAALIGCCVILRRRRSERSSSVFNQPTGMRHAPPPMTAVTHSSNSREPEIIPGARVARMSALEAPSRSSGRLSSPGIFGGFGTSTSSESYRESPDTHRSAVGRLPKRDGSLSSRSALDGLDGPEDSSSPKASDGPEYSSPEGVASGQSEQLSSFKDYYSQDEIRPGDAVATLWAYQPRANDEFELERGDMLKVIGIWDDGWATGVKLTEKAEEWEIRRFGNRDSGVSNGSRHEGGGGGGSPSRPVSPNRAQVESGEIKAFPLVCVCLPQHWRKTIEGDPGDGTGPPPPPGSP